MKTVRDLALATLAAALLGGCGTLPSSAETDTAAPAREAASETPARARATGTPSETRLESRIVSLPFRVDITFSDAALAKLRETGASLGVSADYYGAPLDPSAPGLDPQLGVWLGGEMETIDPGARSLTMKGQVDAARVEREVRGDARVKVMVFPVRAYAAQALITCSEFDDYLSLAVETGGMVHCELAGK
jgi:hypothetical protein